MVAVGIGVLPGIVAIVIDVNRRRGVLLGIDGGGGGDPHRVAVLVRVGARIGVAPDPEAHLHLGAQRGLGDQREPAVVGLVGGGGRAGAVHRAEGVERRTGGIELVGPVIGAAIAGGQGDAPVAACGHTDGGDGEGAGAVAVRIVHGDGGGAGVVEEHGGAVVRGRRDRGEVIRAPPGGRQQGGVAALVLRPGPPGEHDHLHRLVGKHAPADVHVGHVGARALGQGDRALERPVVVGVDPDGGPAGPGHDRQRGVGEHVRIVGQRSALGVGRHVGAHRHAVFRPPEPLLQQLDATGHHRVGGGREAQLGDRDRLERGDLVAGVVVQHRLQGGRVHVVAQVEHRARRDQVAGVARRVAVGRIAVAEHQGGGLLRGGDVLLVAVLPVVVGDHGVVGQGRDGQEHGQRVHRVGVDPPVGGQLVVLRERDVIDLRGRRVLPVRACQAGDAGHERAQQDPGDASVHCRCLAVR